MDGDLDSGTLMATQHDKIFKQLLRAFLTDFVRLVLPQASDRLDLSSPVFLDKELFAGGPHGRRREPDLLVRVCTVDARPLLIHVEIEARASGGMGERLWRYGNQIQARYDVLVLSVVMYLKRGRPGVRLEMRESGLGQDFPVIPYVSFGLERSRAAEYLDRPEPLAWAFASLMDPGSWSRAELKMACIRRIAGVKGRIDPFLLADCVENYLQLEPQEAAEFELLTARRENQEVRAVKLTWSEALREEGREEGLAEGAQKVLLLLLGKRFGPLPENVCRRVEAIDSLDLLTRLAERLLSAHSLEEMGLA